MQKELTEIINLVKNTLKGTNTYIVGGFLRDLLMKKATRDIDFVADRDVKKNAEIISKSIHGTLVVLGAKRKKNTVYRVVTKNGYNLDFSELHGKDISYDLEYRDFTVNALALKLDDFRGELASFKSRLIDKFGGINDLKARRISATSGRVFTEDPLRMLRAYRFKAQLGFEIDRETGSLIKKQSSLIKKSSKERVHDELLLILESRNSAPVIMEMEKNGLISALVPEIKDMKRSSRRYYFHSEGLWQHSKETLFALETILNNINKYFRGYGKDILNQIDKHKGLLKLIALLHDIGKPKTVQVIKGRTRFFEHETKGMKMAAKILKRLKFSNKDIATAQVLIRSHMRPGNLVQSGIITRRALYRFFRDIGEESVELLLLSFADRFSYISTKKTKKEVEEIINFRKPALKIIKAFLEYKKTSLDKKIVNGNMVMEKFSLPPGPLIGKILKITDERQALGKIHSKEEAFTLIEKHLPELIEK